MIRTIQISITTVTAFRAALAVVFFMLAGIQPGLAAIAQSCLSNVEAPEVAATSHVHAEHTGSHIVPAPPDGAEAGHAHASEKSLDCACQMHCSTVQAIAVDSPDPIRLTLGRSYIVAVSAPLPLGEYPPAIRPPRT